MSAISDARWRAAAAALKAVARRRGVDAAEVDDVVQSALEKALRRLDSLSNADRFEPWLKRIAANEALDRRRARRRREAALTAAAEAHAALASAQPAAPDPVIGFADCLEPFLRRLPRADAEILRRKDLEGRAIAEIAAETALSLPAAKSRVLRARRRLADALRACCPSSGCDHRPGGDSSCCGDGPTTA